MSDGDYGDQSFEEKIRAIFKEVSRSIEDAAENIDLDEIADRIGMSSDRFREFAETAGEWLTHQFFEGQQPFGDTPTHDAPADTQQPSREPRARRGGPHPRDLPTEEQGLALSALESGRWTVSPGTDELQSHGEGPSLEAARGLVGELRARDWIAASGEVTLVGRDALRRWLASTSDS
jgi:hypothetical protein